MTSAQYWVALVLPALSTAAVIAVLRRTALARLLADIPNARSLHDTPKPRLGGIAWMASALCVAAAYAYRDLGAVLACAAMLAVVSALDDRRSLPVALRLSVHALAALVALLTAMAELPAWQLAAALLALVWMTNLYNFMDGADGLAGGMALIGFAAMAWAAYEAGASALALACAAIASGSLGFLAFNWPPARVFLGDAGSVPLGFLAGALGLLGAASGAWPLAFPLVLFSPFVVDATATIARRLLRGEKVWVAHRGHYYQRLVLAGWSARRLAAAQYALMAACAAVALALRGTGTMLQCGILALLSTAYVVLLIALDRWLQEQQQREERRDK
jgi:UDP-N-acetylmuramyl pentapeptide phosphotransferase/UDP-N-acetylglucosamine-1-phosphate transferase